MREEIKKFVIQEIEKLSEQFNQISFKYGFDKVGKQHIVKVEPDTEFKNEAYMDAEYDFVDGFISKFPDEEILFISNNKYVTIEKVFYVKEGRVTVENNCISGYVLHSNNAIISAPFSLEDYFVKEESLKNLFVSKPLPVNLNNTVNAESFASSKYSNDSEYALAA